MSLAPAEYQEHGNYNLTLTASNAVTDAVIQITDMVRILYGIENPRVNISQPFLVHPQDVIEFTVRLDQGSQMTFNLTCSDDYSVSRDALSSHSL